MPKNLLPSPVDVVSTHEQRSKLRRSPLFSLCLTVTLLFSFGLAIPQSVFADKSAASQHWVGTWSTSPVEEGEAFEGQTLRQIVRISIGGDQVRVRFSNRFGAVPLVIDSASIGIQDIGAAVVPGSLRELTFGGEPSVAIAAGAKVWSDPVELAVSDEADLAVSSYIAENNTGGSTMHTRAWQTSYVSPFGDFTDDEVMPVLPGDEGTTTSWFWLTGVDVLAQRNTFAVATLGDSITEGCCRDDFVDANVRYPDQLARLLLDRYSGEPRVAVLNSGISGNRVLNDVFGPNAQVRLDPDVLTQSGVTHVILLEGVNDLGIGTALFGPIVEVDEIISGYKQIINRVHSAGLKILVGTVLPFKGFEDILPNYWTPENEAKRQEVNAWIRTTDLHDGFVDFDAAIRDPDDPERMLPIYDGGDALHPSAAGYERMAIEAETALLLPGQGRIKGR
jgi:lysophospholipase L1-like esterase